MPSPAVARQLQALAKAGLKWGRSAAQQGWSAAVEFGAATKEAAADQWHKAQRAGKEAVAGMAASGAEKGAQWATANPERFDELRQKLDKRDRFSSSQVCQGCAPDNSPRHPDPRDGHYMGHDCPKTQPGRPTRGVRPDCAGAGGAHKPFPQVTFTNGINNTPQQVCDTLHALANSRCAEVVAIYNATYADPSLKPPERRWDDYQDAAKEGAEGAARAARMARVTGSPKVIAAAAAVGGVAGATPEVALQEASRLGAVQDVMDCADTIVGSGQDAAAKRLAGDIVKALSGPSPGMAIYAHSQGGLNTAEGIAQAKGEMVAIAEGRLLASGVEEVEAARRAQTMVEKQLGALKVHTFGTLERDLPDGPVYHRFTNELDPIPKVIRAAQKGLKPEAAFTDPSNSPPVERFSSAPSWSPIAAHGMVEAYLPNLDQKHPKGRCC
ncbi:MAG: hypothetical protein LW854_17850 [Rubrivivax sp.]|jgi:hypothetical protein|nr:hypothetical protein [Rubrivivax sp.]